MNQKSNVFIVIVVYQIMTCSSFAQPIPGPIEIPSTFNPVGSGARAIGSGGAFISICDDGTCASWNPGGLAQLKHHECAFVNDLTHRIDYNRFSVDPHAKYEENDTAFDINYLSFVYQFTGFERYMVFALNYQKLYDFNRNWDFSLNTSNESLTRSALYSFHQDGDLSAIGLAYCIRIVPEFSIGLTYNLWENPFGINGWEQKSKQTSHGVVSFPDQTHFPFHSRYTIYDRYRFKGRNLNLGILWKITPKMSFGAVLKTSFIADLKHERIIASSLSMNNQTSSVPSHRINNKRFHMPESYGFGMSYRFSDQMTASFDLYKTSWQDCYVEDDAGQKRYPFVDPFIQAPEIDSTIQLRMGFEYLYLNAHNSRYIVPFRWGLFYDPAPAHQKPDHYFGFTIGTGLASGPNIFDMAAQFRFGNNVGGSILKDMEFSQNVLEIKLYASFIYHIQ
jgi:hypothetical protein